MESIQRQLTTVYTELNKNVKILQLLQSSLEERRAQLHLNMNKSAKTLEPHVEDCNSSYAKLVSDISACEEKQKQWTCEYEQCSSNLTKSGISPSALEAALAALTEEKENAEKQQLYEVTLLYKQLQGEKYKLGKIHMAMDGEHIDEDMCHGVYADIRDAKQQMVRCDSKLEMLGGRIKRMEELMSKVQQYYIDTAIHKENIASDPVRGTMNMVSMEREKIQATAQFLKRMLITCEKYGMRQELESTISSEIDHVRERINRCLESIEWCMQNAQPQGTLYQIALAEQKLFKDISI